MKLNYFVRYTSPMRFAALFSFIALQMYAGTIVVTDGTFNNGNWTTSTNGSPGSSESAFQISSGGNPGAYRQTQLDTGAGSFNFSDVLSLYNVFTYNPATQAASDEFQPREAYSYVRFYLILTNHGRFRRGNGDAGRCAVWWPDNTRRADVLARSKSIENDQRQQPTAHADEDRGRAGDLERYRIFKVCEHTDLLLHYTPVSDSDGWPAISCSRCREL